MKVGIVLEGGAMRALYMCGVLDTLMEEGIKLDAFIGVSAGALFSLNYVSGQKGRALRYNKVYAGDKRYMGLHSLLTTGNIVNKQFAYYDVTTKYDLFDQQAFRDAKAEFLVTVTNVETGEAEYIPITDVLEQMEALRATSAMPFVSRIVEWNGKKYLDGAIADAIPLEKALQMGYDKLIVVLTRPSSYRKKPANRLMLRLFYGKYKNFTNTFSQRHIQYNETVAKVAQLEQEQKIFAIRPSRTIKVKKVEKDKEKLQQIYDLGVADMKKELNSLKHYLNILQSESD